MIKVTVNIPSRIELDAYNMLKESCNDSKLFEAIMNNNFKSYYSDLENACNDGIVVARKFSNEGVSGKLTEINRADNSIKVYYTEVRYVSSLNEQLFIKAYLKGDYDAQIELTNGYTRDGYIPVLINDNGKIIETYNHFTINNVILSPTVEEIELANEESGLTEAEKNIDRLVINYNESKNAKEVKKEDDN